MKKLGLVGGTGPESTAIYYREINRIVNARTEGRLFPELALESINLNKALAYCRQERYEELTDYLLQAITNLARSGAEFAALSANTMHIVFDALEKRSPLPLVSILETTCAAARCSGLQKIGLLGTIFTMEGDFFTRPFVEQGIEIITPNAPARHLVNNRIANELELGIVKETTRQELLAVIDDMYRQDKIEAVILGCTELPLALSSENCPVPCLDTMQIHIAALVDKIME